MERRGFLSAVALSAAGVALESGAGEDGRIRVERVEDFDWPWEGGKKAGLYSTFVGVRMGLGGSLSGEVLKTLGLAKGYDSGSVNIKGTSVRMKREDGADVDIRLLGVVQNRGAPLVAVIPGMCGLANGRENILWMKWLGEKGYNVVSWDSTFHPVMIGTRTYGMPGNLENEARFCGQLVKRFADQNGISPNRIGIASRSYGGAVSLNMGKLSEEGRLGVHIDRVLAFCPPVSMEETMDLLDEAHRRAMANIEHNKNTLALLAQEFLLNLKIREDISDFDEERAEWFLGRAFNWGVGDTFYKSVKCHPEVEKHIVIRGQSLKQALVDETDEEGVRRNWTDALNYNAFYSSVIGSYWENRGVSRRQILDYGDIGKVLRGVGRGVDVILTTDDPINKPGAVEGLEGASSRGRVIKSNKGGHCGFCDNNWTRRALQGMFGE